jgi:hypothetical protein
MLRPASVHVGWAVYLHHYVASGAGRLPARKPARAGMPGTKFSRKTSDTVGLLRVFHEIRNTSYEVVKCAVSVVT